jgi:hypothetical protein
MSVSGDRKPIFATGWGNADVAAGAGTVITPSGAEIVRCRADPERHCGLL